MHPRKSTAARAAGGLILALALPAAAQVSAGTPAAKPEQPIPMISTCGYPPTNACVARWTCVDGAWEPSVYKASGTACNDGNACTYNDKCDGAGSCSGTPVTCASDACATRSCNGTSACTVSYASTATSCNDGNACTYGDHCNGAGGCIGGATITCASDACTTRTCNGTATCTISNAPSGKACGTTSAPCLSACNGAGVCSPDAKASRGVACPYPTACAQVCDGVSGTCQPAE